MKIALGGDQHLTNHKPKNRIDDYPAKVISKFRQEFEIAHEADCTCIVFPGDLFETHRENHKVVQSVMDVLNEYPDISVLVVAGQHDQKYHNDDLSGTAFQTLITSGYFRLLGAKPLTVDGVDFYGASWKEDIPEIDDFNGTNILVTHRMIVNEKLWAEQEGHTWANHLLLKTKFDLIVSGDNHQQFTSSKGSRHLVNMGSMMRSTIAQVNHEPALTIYDTEDKTITVVPLTIEPIDKVMSIVKAEKEKEQKLQTAAFVESMKGDIGSAKLKLSYADAVAKKLEELDEAPEVAEIIEECFDED
jgi:DNA repair exonuclease SbcCD nuclease subunit